MQVDNHKQSKKDHILLLLTTYNIHVNNTNHHNKPITSLYTKLPTYTYNLYHLTAQPNHATLLANKCSMFGRLPALAITTQIKIQTKHINI